MKSRLLVILVFFAVAVLQVTLAGGVSVFGVKPNLMLVAVYALSITGGEWRGLMYGSIGGFIEDCLSGGLMGLFLSGFALSGYIAGRAGSKVFNVGESANFSGIFALSLVQGVYTTLLLNTFMENYDAFGSLWRLVLPQAIYNAVAGAIILWLFKEQLSSRVPWLKTIRQFQVRL
jgi:rod shape-determining protein MreD